MYMRMNEGQRVCTPNIFCECLLTKVLLETRLVNKKKKKEEVLITQTAVSSRFVYSDHCLYFFLL